MMDKKGFVVRAAQSLPDERQTLRTRLGALLPLLPLSAGHALWLCGAFPSLPLAWTAFWPMLFCLSGVLLLTCGTRTEKYGYAAVSLCGILLFVFYYKSFYVLVNDFFSALQHTSGHIYLHFETAGHMTPVVLCIVCLSAVLLSRAVYAGSMLYLLPVLVLMVEGAVSAVVPFSIGMALYAVGLVLLFRRQGLSLRGISGRAAATAVCILIAIGVAAPTRNITGNRLYPALREAVHGMVYDSRTNTMPEGSLTKIKPFDKNETAALRVTLEKPQQLYLRGHIYETYTAAAWQPLSAGTRDGYAQLFYWLHDAGYYAQTQVASALREAGEAAAQRVTVENVSACRAHGYLPYGAWGVSADETLIGDAVLPQTNTFSLYADDADALQRAQAELAENGKAHGAYLRLEQAFADYAEKADLAIPSDARAVLDREFADRVPHSGMLSDVRKAIRSYLDETLTYDEQAAGTDRKTDFLTYLLEDTRCGYSVHYATAATLLLRYCGVPARYVEGYYLPQGESGTVTLTEANAHAWAELYLDGVGFIPFEVTPGYAGAESPQKDGDQTTRRTPPSPAVAPFNAPPETVQPQETPEEVPTSLWWIWLLCAAVLLFGAALWVLLRRRRLRRALRDARSLPPREAVLRLYGYVMLLRRYAPDARENTPQITQIVELAQFSDHEITDAQKSALDAFCADVQSDCLARWNIVQKSYYRFILCIIV